MPENKRIFLCLISGSYEGTPKKKSCVCRKPPIFMANKTPIDGKVLHTFKVLN